MEQLRRKSAPRAIVPVWAQVIEAERRGDMLLVTGFRRISNPIDTREVEPGHISQLDILQRLRRYALRNLEKKQKSAEVGVYQFADATDDKKLMAFCEEFGPICGKVRSKSYEVGYGSTLTVFQSLKSLRDSQRKFAASVKLLQQINRNGRADRSLMLEAIQDTQVYEPLYISNLWEFFDTPLVKTEMLAIACSALCEVLNKFPLQLFSVGGELIELPRTQDEGIEGALYHPLRLDYMAQRQIGTCLHCGRHFTVFKRGTRGCSEQCRRVLRNQKYWAKSKEVINAERRQNGQGRK
jgi:hypothetical protein